MNKRNFYFFIFFFLFAIFSLGVVSSQPVKVSELEFIANYTQISNALFLGAIYDSADLYHLYVLNNTNDVISHYTLNLTEVGYNYINLANLTLQPDTLNISGIVVNPVQAYIQGLGNKIYITHDNTGVTFTAGTIYQFSLSDSRNLSSATLTGNINVGGKCGVSGAGLNRLRGVSFSLDGLSALVAYDGSSGSCGVNPKAYIIRYTCTTPFLITSCTETENKFLTLDTISSPSFYSNGINTYVFGKQYFNNSGDLYLSLNYINLSANISQSSLALNFFVPDENFGVAYTKGFEVYGLPAQVIQNLVPQLMGYNSVIHLDLDNYLAGAILEEYVLVQAPSGAVYQLFEGDNVSISSMGFASAYFQLVNGVLTINSLTRDDVYQISLVGCPNFAQTNCVSTSSSLTISSAVVPPPNTSMIQQIGIQNNVGMNLTETKFATDVDSLYINYNITYANINNVIDIFPEQSGIIRDGDNSPIASFYFYKNRSLFVESYGVPFTIPIKIVVCPSSQGLFPIQPNTIPNGCQSQTFNVIASSSGTEGTGTGTGGTSSTSGRFFTSAINNIFPNYLELSFGTRILYVIMTIVITFLIILLSLVVIAYIFSKDGLTSGIIMASAIFSGLISFLWIFYFISIQYIPIAVFVGICLTLIAIVYLAVRSRST